MITLNYDSAIQKYLKRGEQVFWVGQPRQGWAFRWYNRLVVLQMASAVIIAWWLIALALWMAGRGGPFPHTGSLPGDVAIVACVAGTIWQQIHDKRRRAGTWYAVTDRRLLFVLTTVRPESVIAIAYDEIVEISAHQRRYGASPGEGTLKIRLKEIDPYMAASTVLGYQMGVRTIVLETMPAVQDLCEMIDKRRALAVSDDNQTSDLASPAKG
jgi:hypothetical protein